MPRVSPLTTAEFIERAQAKHGDTYGYKETIYITADKMVKIYCKTCRKHFEQIAKSHTSGHGCPTCIGLKGRFKSDGREGFITKALKMHGDLYSYDRVEYVNCKEEVKIYCKACEKYFKQAPRVHLRGSGCQKCANKKNVPNITFDQMLANSVEKFGDIFEYDRESYINTVTPVQITCKICKNSFTRQTSMHMFNLGCPFCSGARLSYDKFVERARIIHGAKYTYHQDTFQGSAEKMKIYCKECEHDFYQSPNSHADHGQGCPHCSSYKTERLCREIIEDLRDLKFPKTRPAFLGGLELDGYNEEIKIAFEYQGMQHYKFVPFLQHYEQCFYEQVERDARKRRLCAENGVHLIEIPYTHDTRDKIEEFLVNHFLRKRYPNLLPEPNAESSVES